MSAFAVLFVAVLLGGSMGAAVVYWPSAALVLIAIAVLLILAKLGVDRMPEMDDGIPLWEPFDYEPDEPELLDHCRACKTEYDECVCGSGFCLDCCACFYAEDLREAEGVL